MVKRSRRLAFVLFALALTALTYAPVNAEAVVEDPSCGSCQNRVSCCACFCEGGFICTLLCV